MQRSTLYLEANAQLSPEQQEMHTPERPHRTEHTPQKRSPLNYSPFGAKAISAGSMRPIHQYRRLSPGSQNNVLNASDNSSSFYKNYDIVTRVNQTLAQQASTAGRRALATTAIYKDSPMRPMPMSKVSASFSHTSPVRSELPLLQFPPSPDETVPTTSKDLLKRMFRSGGIISPLEESPMKRTRQADQYQTFMPTGALEEFVDNQSTERARAQSYPVFKNAEVRELENVLDTAGTQVGNLAGSVELKIHAFLQLVHHLRKDVRLGGLTAVHLLIIHNSDNISQDIADLILEEVFTELARLEAQEELFLILALEVIQLLAPHNQSHTARLSLLKVMLFDSPPRVQRSAVNAMMTMGYEGIAELVELASKEYNSLQSFILESLARTPHIQKLVIVPSLFNTLCTSRKPVERQTALAALNRMHDTTLLAGGLQILLNLLEDGVVDRQLVASVIRATGEVGEQALLNVLKSQSSEKVKVAVTSVLQWRVPFNPPFLHIQMDNNEIITLTQAQAIGTLCTYNGEITPLAFYDFTDVEVVRARRQEYLEINTRDFLASLRRMLALNADHSEVKIFPHPQKSVVSRLSPLNLESSIRYDANLFPNPPDPHEEKKEEVDEDQEEEEEEEVELESISPAVIRGLCHALKDRSRELRETAAGALGTISVPEAVEALQALLETAQDQDSNVRAMAIWAIGRLGSEAVPRGIKCVVRALKDSYWKVRTAACIAAGCLGPKAAPHALPSLTKLLRDGTVNRQTVAQTIINLGALGQQTLVQLLKCQPQSNTKLRSCIVRALALANVSEPTIDFAIQALFKASKDRTPQVRKDALLSLDVLHKNAMDSVTYLRPRHLLPFFYQCLNDQDRGVRQVDCSFYFLQAAIGCIRSFGPQGELIFIQGLTKDKNPHIRSQCAYGLGQIGPSTFRTLLLGLHDSQASVRESAGRAIMRKMPLQSLLQTFHNKPHQCQAIRCTVKEVLGLSYGFSHELTTYLNKLLERISPKSASRGELKHEFGLTPSRTFL